MVSGGFIQEWKITPTGWKIFLAVMALICVVNVAEGIYAAPDALTLTQVVTYRILRGCIVLILPFMLATRARRRGRRFGVWLISAMLFNPIVVGVVYWVTVRKEDEKPKADDLAVAPEMETGRE